MNEEVKWLWITALRCGGFKRNHIVNVNVYGFSVFGVLCALYARCNPIDIETKNDMIEFDGDAWGAPSSVVRWAEISEKEYQLIEFLEMKQSFRTMSDIIERL